MFLNFFFQPGVVSLQKLLVREKAGQDSRGIYLISSNPKEPEMFELKVHKPKDKQAWIQAIRFVFVDFISAVRTSKFGNPFLFFRAAVQCCPEEDEDGALLSQEERQRLLDDKQTQIRQIVGKWFIFTGIVKKNGNMKEKTVDLFKILLVLIGRKI